MFFIMGINQGRKDFDYHQLVICKDCGSYGRYQVYMTYMCLSLFFIPVFKWNKQYYVETGCCHRVYELDPEIGRRIARGEETEIRSEHLKRVRTGYDNGYKRCGNCGFETREDFIFCPKCGSKL